YAPTVNPDGCNTSAPGSGETIGLPTCIRGLDMDSPNPAAPSYQEAAGTQANIAPPIKVMVVPVYDAVTIEGSAKYYHIITFAALYVSGVCMNGSYGGTGDCSNAAPRTIRANFVNYVLTGQFCDPQTDTSCPQNYGVSVIKLRQ